MKKIFLILCIISTFIGCNIDNSRYVYTLDVIYSNGDRDTFSIIGYNRASFSIDRSTFSSKSDLVQYDFGEKVIATNVRRFNILSIIKMK